MTQLAQQLDTEVSALDIALGAVGEAKRKFVEAVAAHSPVKANAADLLKAVRSTKRALTWALVDASHHTEEGERDAFVTEQTTEMAKVLGYKEGDGNARKMLQGMRAAAVTYLAKVVQTDAERRAKADATSIGMDHHKARERTDAAKQDRKLYGARATALAADHMGLSADDFRDLLDDGDTEAHETRNRFIALLKNEGAWHAQASEGYVAASERARAEFRRAVVAKMSAEDKAAWLAALAD